MSRDSIAAIASSTNAGEMCPGRRVEDPDQRFTALDGERSKVAVVSEDHAAERVGATKNINVACAREALLVHGTDVLALYDKGSDHRGLDVLVGQQRKAERLHAGIFNPKQLRS